MVFLISSNEPWGDMWFSKQNYAYELSREHRVYFLNPPKKWTLKQFISPYIEAKNYSENLIVVDYHSYLPLRSNWLNERNNALCSALIRRFLQERGEHDYTLWAFDPTRLYRPKLLGCKQAVFHCVDHYYFQYIGERILCQEADAIFASSQSYLDNYQDFDKPKYIVPHGISTDEFACPPEAAPKDIPQGGYILYVGSIDWRMDYALMERMIARYPQERFLFIGMLKETGDAAQKRLFVEKRYQNLQFLGTRHYKSLKYYSEQAKACLFLINFNLHFSSVHQHKTLGYLAFGKPVFGMRSYEYQKQKELMYLGENEAELFAYMDAFLGGKIEESPELIEARKDYARANSFDIILEKALGYLQQL